MGISTFMVGVNYMHAYIYKVDGAANWVEHQRLRVATDTCSLYPKHCCVVLSQFSNCCRRTQMDIQSSCHYCTSNPVDHASWSVPLQLPSFPDPDLVVLRNMFKEAQGGWTQLPARLSGLGVCFGQAILWFFFFFWKEHIDEWFESAGALIVWGLHDWLEESMAAFQLISVSTGVRSTVPKQELFELHKGYTLPVVAEIPHCKLGWSSELFLPCKPRSAPLTWLYEFWISATTTKSSIWSSVSSYRVIHNRVMTFLFSLVLHRVLLHSSEWQLLPHRDTCSKYGRGWCLFSLVSVEMTLTNKLQVTISMQVINMIQVFGFCCRAPLSQTEKVINISGVTAKM